MHKTLKGVVVSTKMTGTAVVEVSWRTPHPVYGKLLKRSKKYKVDPNNMTMSVGDTVKIEEMRKVAKGKYFKVVEVLNVRKQQIREEAHKEETE
jgi:small subunit ribosomal protein S17